MFLPLKMIRLDFVRIRSSWRPTFEFSGRQRRSAGKMG